jgi:hypothetical protein
VSNIESQPRAGLRGVGIGIVAFGATKMLVNWDSPEWSYWSMNDSYAIFAKRLGKLFEMHPIKHYTDPVQYTPDHEARMASFAAGTVMLAFPNPKIPNADVYPLDKILARFGRRYFTSSITYMIPYAIMTIEKSLRDGDGIYAPRIGMWGCDMGLTSEYAKERSCTEYWLAKAEGAGIEVYVPPESPILKAGYDYGYETAAISAHQRIIAARRKELQEQLDLALQADRVANDRVSAIQGMMSEVTFFETSLTPSPPLAQTFK